MPDRAERKLHQSYYLIFGIALAVRFGVLAASWRHGFSSPIEPYGFEVGNVAASIVRGKGFSSPSPLVDSGPTAWLCPIYPYLAAAVFKIWGIFSFPSLIALQVINCVFSALVIFPLRAIGIRNFGPRVAVAACWLWVFLPNAWHIPVQYIWDTSLSALALAVLFWATLAIREQSGLLMWAGYGALWAIALLINATFASLLPFFFLWLAWTARKRRFPWLAQLITTTAILLLGMLPWVIRNDHVFGKTVFLRSSLGIMLWSGNNAIDATTDPFARSPLRYPPEAAEFGRLGEIDYMHSKEQQAIEFIRSHPAYTARLVLRRVGLNWFSVTDRVNSTWLDEPAYLKLYGIANAALVVLSWFGLAMFLRTRSPDAIPFLITFLFFPVVYYLTVALVRYQFPIEPIVAVLAAYGAFQVFGLRQESSNHVPFLRPNFERREPA